MTIKIITLFFNIISFSKLRLKWHHFICAQKVTLGKRSKFYKTANIENLQNDKQKINIGNDSHIRAELLVFAHGGTISIGDYCYIGEGSRIWSSEEINIGNNVLIAHNVNIHDNNSHPIDAKLRHEHFKHIISKGHPTSNINFGEKAVIINDDAWIGFNATILKGVTIGKRAIVGASAVVTESIPDDAIVVGNPAKIIGYVNNKK